MVEQGNLSMKNKFGREIQVINIGDIYRQLQEAKIRHLKNVRMRYLDYVIKMANPKDRVISNAILAERMYKQSQKERT